MFSTSRTCRTTLVALTAALLLSLGSARTAKAQAEPLIGQMMLFAGDFCPRYWAEANGQLLPISENSALFSIIGTMYGGDGITTMALPDLRGRTPMHVGYGPGLSAYSVQGQKVGSEQITQTINQMPAHNHQVNATGKRGNKNYPGDGLLARPEALNLPSDQEPIGIYRDDEPTKTMRPDMITNTGGNQPMDIRNPRLVMRWCVALYGVYPSRN